MSATREGDLTASQFEILSAIWPKGRCGASIAEIWEVVSEERDIARTTILNQVQRLENRGWVRRQPARPNQDGHGSRFVVTTGPKRAKMELVRKILNDYFEGSISELVMGYLGGKLPDANRVEQAIELLQQSKGEKLDKESAREIVRLIACE